jgi:hypothetical protein
MKYVKRYQQVHYNFQLKYQELRPSSLITCGKFSSIQLPQ